VQQSEPSNPAVFARLKFASSVHSVQRVRVTDLRINPTLYKIDHIMAGGARRDHRGADPGRPGDQAVGAGVRLFWNEPSHL
jgi:hypothetical protein